MNRGAHAESLTLRKALERLYRYHPRKIDLSLGRIRRLLAALDHPERKLPPVFHVAGTNGKGSVVAYLRAMFEAAGLRAHVYTSPHLVRFNERIRLSGKLIEDKRLLDCIVRCERANGRKPITFFEITTAAALLAFAETEADVCLLEVGLGGRLDATNVIDHPAACVIAPVGLDHAAFLGDEPQAVAREKAGIAKPGAPLVVCRQAPEILKAIRAYGKKADANLFVEGEDWTAEKTAHGFHFVGFGRDLALPAPSLPGDHQIGNAALSLAALFAQSHIAVPESEIADGLRSAKWPARFQLLDPARFRAKLPAGSCIWLDGGHNPLAASALARHLRDALDVKRPFYLVAGMIEGKDAKGFLGPLAPFAKRVFTVPVPGKEKPISPAALTAFAVEAGAKAEPVADVEAALARIARLETGPAQVLITGSLYLAGVVLKEAGIVPE